MLVEEWAAASEDNRAFFQSLHKSWLEAGAEVYRLPDVQQEWNDFLQCQQQAAPQQEQPAVSARRLWLTRVAAAASVVAAAFAGFYLFNSKNQNEPTLIAVAKDKPAEVKLQDGSSMTVEPEGELVYPVKFKKDSREVSLVGSGSFDVTHLPEQPFIVHLGDLHVKVLGTAFRISRAPKEVSVAVSKGRVAFYNKKDTLYITAGETGRYYRPDKKFLLEKAVPLTGTFHFEATPLSEVAAALGAHFHTEIKLVNPGLKNCKLSAGFEDQSLNDIVRDITLTLNLSYKIEASLIYIDGPSCR